MVGWTAVDCSGIGRRVIGYDMLPSQSRMVLYCFMILLKSQNPQINRDLWDATVSVQTVHAQWPGMNETTTIFHGQEHARVMSSGSVTCFS